MHYAILAALVAVAAASADARTAEPESGKDLYVRYCASCHGSDATGGTALAKLMSIPTPDLTRIAIRRDGWFPEATVREIVDGRYEAHGSRTMPVWGAVLTEDQIRSITEHLFSLQVAPSTGAAPPGE
jgi:mono/diheme cytochrome c family protein